MIENKQLQRQLLEQVFVQNNVILERSGQFHGQGPRESTLRRILQSGVLGALLQIWDEHPDTIREILIRPLLAETPRQILNSPPWDRMFVTINPEKYHDVIGLLKGLGVKVNEAERLSPITPYYFDKKGRQSGFVAGVQNHDEFIIAADFPRK